MLFHISASPAAKMATDSKQLRNYNSKILERPLTHKIQKNIEYEKEVI